MEKLTYALCEQVICFGKLSQVFSEKMCVQIREEKRNRYQAGIDTKHTKQNPNKHPGSPTFSTGQEVPGGEGCLWKEHLHAIRVSTTKRLASTTLSQPWQSLVFLWAGFVCRGGDRISIQPYLMFAYLQFVTWLVYFSFRSFRAHLCPDGLISGGLVPGRKNPPG